MGKEGLRVLVGSPVRQTPTILSEFLHSLACLDDQGLHVDYYFVDDNEDVISSALLDTFSVGRKVQLVAGQPTGQAYVKDDETHRWNEGLIWKVARYKDQMICHALQEGYDYLFLIDSDLVLHPQTLQQLIRGGKSVISEVFWTEWKPEQPELPQVWLRDQYTLCPSHRGEQLSPEVASQRTAAFLHQLRTPGVYEVGGLGACTLIRRDALEAGVSFAEIPNVSFWGEDRHFCIRAAALGLKLYVDTHLPAYHIYRECDLDGVGDYRRSNPDSAGLTAIFDVVKNGLEAMGTSDYRTMTGLEGAEYFTPDLRKLREAEREQALLQAHNGKTITQTLVSGCKLLVGEPGCEHIGVLVGLVNFGEDGGQRFVDRFVARVVVQRCDGQWLISNAEFDALGSKQNATAHEDQGSLKIPLFIPKATGNKLVLSMVVRNEADRYLRSVLQHAASYVDEFVILDDASEDDTTKVCQEAVNGKPLTLFKNTTSMFRDEYRLRQRQWELTLRAEPDWILFLDADEMFEDRIRDAIRPMIDQTTLDVICFRLYDMWDMEHYREDEYWRAHLIYRPFLIRYRPDFPYRWKETAQHCGRMPVNVLELPSATSQIRLKHYGWAKPSDREAKYRRYMELDPNGLHGVMGQYQSILDQHPRLLRWEE